MGCRGGSRAQELVFEPWPVDRDDEPPRRGLTGVSDRNSPRRALAVRPFWGVVVALSAVCWVGILGAAMAEVLLGATEGAVELRLGGQTEFRALL
jgi:hypothetical protein